MDITQRIEFVPGVAVAEQLAVAEEQRLIEARPDARRTRSACICSNSRSNPCLRESVGIGSAFCTLIGISSDRNCEALRR